MSTITRTRSQVNQTTKHSIKPVSRSNRAVRAEDEEPTLQYTGQFAGQNPDQTPDHPQQGMTGLEDAGAFLAKSRIAPSESQLRSAHETSPKRIARRGQLIDILV